MFFTFYDYNVFLSRERLYSVGGLFERSNLRESHIDVIFSIQQFLYTADRNMMPY